MKLGAKKPRLPENIKWRTLKCLCNDPHCHTYSIEHPDVGGCFYQGCGWNQETAQKICDVLNAGWNDHARS